MHFQCEENGQDGDSDQERHQQLEGHVGLAPDQEIDDHHHHAGHELGFVVYCGEVRCEGMRSAMAYSFHGKDDVDTDVERNHRL